jgi:hypothetical protein
MTEAEKIEQYFRTVPKEDIETAIFSDEDGTFYGYGHIDPVAMAADILALDTYNQGVPSELKVNPEDIVHNYARLLNVGVDLDGDEEYAFITCTGKTEDAFPITYWNY